MTEPAWLTVARQEQAKNIHEFPGSWQDNPEILKYFEATNYGNPLHDEVPWCAAFECWCLEKAGIKSPRSAAAADFRNWGEKLDEPRPGCIAVLNHHVTFYIKDNGDGWFTGLGGNQGNRVKESNYLLDDVVSYRWPKEA